MVAAIEFLTDPFSGGIGVRALLEVVLVGGACAPVGVWIVLYRQSYAAESIAHAMLPGLVIATLASIPLGLGAAAGLLVAAVLIGAASRQRLVGTDGAVAVVVTGLFGLGTLLALSPDVPVRLGDALFGNPLSVSEGDLAATAALAALLIVALSAGLRPLAAAGFDPSSARSLGASPGVASVSVLVLLAATTLVAVTALGNLLVVAILIGPAAAALRLTRRLGPALLLASALGVASGIAGLLISYHLDLAAGASIALCAVAVWLLALPFRAGVMRTSVRYASP